MPKSVIKKNLGQALIKTLFVILLSISNAFANQEDHHAQHVNSHQQLFHAFTFEGDFGEARDGRAKSLDISGWIGGDYNRLWINGEDKKYGHYEQKSMLQALYSRNVSQFWDAQIGVSHDFSAEFSSRNVNYLTIGLEGLLPQSFETRAQIHLSEKGDYSVTLKQEIDIFLTQKLITQPYFEAEIFAQDVDELDVKSGIADAEIGLATRYEITRKFAPYFALRYNRKTFNTARQERMDGNKIDNFIAAIGIRLRF